MYTSVAHICNASVVMMAIVILYNVKQFYRESNLQTYQSQEIHNPLLYTFYLLSIVCMDTCIMVYLLHIVLLLIVYQHACILYIIHSMTSER